jgi:hypothetical protein
VAGSGCRRDDVTAKIDEIARFDERAAAALAVIAAFGLRFKEAVMLRPHVDIVTAAQAGQAAGCVAHYVKLMRGTKGGRFRHVPVDTPEREAAVARARRVAQWDDDSISDPRYTLVQAIRHLRYVIRRRVWVSQAGSGIRASRLRMPTSARTIHHPFAPIRDSAVPPWLVTSIGTRAKSSAASGRLVFGASSRARAICYPLSDYMGTNLPITKAATIGRCWRPAPRRGVSRLET